LSQATSDVCCPSAARRPLLRNSEHTASGGSLGGRA
jgi:hypothetical protein